MKIIDYRSRFIRRASSASSSSTMLHLGAVDGHRWFQTQSWADPADDRVPVIPR